MDSEGSMWCYHDAASLLYLEADECSPHYQNLFLEDPI